MKAQPEIPPEIPKVIVANGKANAPKINAPCVLVCEHASFHIPDEFDDLGLDEEARKSHIAWDPGAATVTLMLSELLDCPAVLSQISRLVYDCNRTPEAKDAVPAQSEIYEIPGNQGLSEQQIAKRVEDYYRPFERALGETIDNLQTPLALVTVHSFTPVFNGEKRDVELGVLHDEDTRLADAMLTIAPRHTDLNVQRNKPYGPEHGVTHTLKIHGVAKRHLNVMLEVRNDLLETPDMCRATTDILAGLLVDALGVCGRENISRRAN